MPGGTGHNRNETTAGAFRRRRKLALLLVDRMMFGFAGVAAVWLALQLLENGLRRNWQVLLLVVFWGLAAYLVLPRLHRVLSYLYVPDYFIGRTRTIDGLLGDPVNLGLLGTEEQIVASMERAGWTRAHEVSVASGLRIIRTTLTRTSYHQAPVSPLLLFERPQDFAFQQEVAGSPSKRHHVRFWRCPTDWLLPGGYAVDWLAAGTYDRNVGLSLFTFQVTHRIDADIDVERDHIIDTVTASCPEVSVKEIANFSAGYHTRNGGGDSFNTDGDLPVVNLRSVEAPTRSSEADHVVRQDKPPAPTVFGGCVAALRGVIFLIASVGLFIDPAAGSQLPIDSPDLVLGLAALFAVLAVVDVIIALAILRGRTWARLVLLIVSAAIVIQVFLRDVAGEPHPTIGHGLPSVALSVLLLLALTSKRARDYSHR